MKFLPWSFYDAAANAGGMLTLKTLMVVSLLLSTAGFLTVISTKTSLLLVVFYQGLLRSFGHFNHDEMLAVYFLVVLAFTPCGDAFSIDSRLGRTKKERPAFAYAYPILLMQLLLAWTYFSSALIKLRVAGWKYLSPDNLPALAIFHSLDNLHDTRFRVRVLVAAGEGSTCRLRWDLCSSGSCSFRSLFSFGASLVDSRNRYRFSLRDPVLDEHLLSAPARDVFGFRQLGPLEVFHAISA